MSWFNRFERWLEPIAVSNITLYIIVGQVFVLGAVTFGLISPDKLVLVPALALDGEWWRVFSFVLIPPFPGGSLGAVFVAFSLYILYMFGTALESRWGVVRYNLFLIVGYVLTVGLAFVTPGMEATNTFIAISVFLAFAYLHPDFMMSLFFILPIKIKWLAAVTWVLMGVKFLAGDLSVKLAVAATVGNFLVFFAHDLWLDAKLGQRRMKMQASQFASAADDDAPRHRCHACAKTSHTDPDLDFRYCSKCSGDQCYCPDHIRNHDHVLIDDGQKN